MLEETRHTGVGTRATTTSASCPLLQPRHHQSEQQLNKRRCIYASTGSAANIMMDRESLSEWAKDKPLSILQLDPADRAVLRIAGEFPVDEVNDIVRYMYDLNWADNIRRTRVKFGIYGLFRIHKEEADLRLLI